MIIKVKKTGLLGKLYEYGDIHVMHSETFAAYDL